MTSAARDQGSDHAAEADASLSYEQARDELVDVVRRLEAGGATLEESLRLWERGEELARICQSWLEGARARLEKAAGQAEDTTEVEDLSRDER